MTVKSTHNIHTHNTSIVSMTHAAGDISVTKIVLHPREKGISHTKIFSTLASHVLTPYLAHKMSISPFNMWRDNACQYRSPVVLAFGLA
jgi:hypothetical protein